MGKIWRRLVMVALAAGTLATLGSGLALAQGFPPFGGQGGGWGGYGPGGMMGGMGGMMGGWAEGSPWRGGYGQYGPYGTQTDPSGLSIDQATDAAKNYLAALGNPDLKLTEVMEFSNHFYAEVAEQSTGIHALELIIDRNTGAVYPEMGPNMMWNTRYSPMASMMGGGMMGWGWFGGWNIAAVTVSPEQAREIANQWLSRYLPGTTAAEADAFYGYYTLHTQRNGQVTGMLSVNASTGQVWYHTWHGSFVQLKELE